MTSVVHSLRAAPERALASAEQSREMSREQRFSLYEILANISRGRALGDLGRLREAETEIKLGLDEVRKNGVAFMRPWPTYSLGWGKMNCAVDRQTSFG
jgi:hypothetical protein